MPNIDRRYQAAVMVQRRFRLSDQRARERRDKFRLIEGGGEPPTPSVVPEGAETTLEEIMKSRLRRRRAALSRLDQD